MSARPLTTLTFLFTDIEGSTRRWEADRAAMSAALARHDALLQSAIDQAGGTVFKTVGDAFHAVFDSPVAGVAAALAAQRALADEDWSLCGTDFAPLRVRMSLHTGEAEARGGDWFGPPLNRAARLLAAAHGGQVLVGAVAVDVLHSAGLAGSDAEPGAELQVDGLPGCTLRDLGRHRFKDLGRPERVWQLAASGLATDFPPILSLDTHPHNLPEQTSSFVGREAELAELVALLGERRLVTVVGVGGSGKTRLAQHAAADCLHRYPDGAWFVDLAPIREPAQVVEKVASILDPGDHELVLKLMGERERQGRESEAAERMVAARLRGRRMLVVLDNCEHVVDACARMAAALARHAPGVTVLATSREPLRIPEETLWPIAPLSTADPALVAQAADPVAELRRYDSARLFIDRARAVQPDFEVTRTNAGAVAEICQRLDGIPLALELAAARVRMMGPAELVRRLDDRFRLLVGGSRVALPRQQTLRAMIDWSYDLLSMDDRRVLCRLAVLAGPIPFAGALAVATDDEEGAQSVPGAGTSTEALLDEMTAMEGLSSLVEKSLLVAQPHDDGIWYRLLDTIRVYALEQLEADDGERARGHLLDWLLAVSSDKTDMREGVDLDEWAAYTAPMVPDIYRSVDWAAGQKARVAAGATLAARFWFTWWRANGHKIVSLLFDAGEDVIAPEDHAMLFYIHGITQEGRNLEAAITSFREAARRFAALGDRLHQSWTVQHEGTVHYRLEQWDEAERCYREAIAIKRMTAMDYDIAISLGWLSEVLRMRNDWAAADATCMEVLDLINEREIQGQGAIWPLHNAGRVKLRLGRVTEAAALLGRSLRLARKLSISWAVPNCLFGLSGIASSRGNGRQAARLVGTAAALADVKAAELLEVGQAGFSTPDAADNHWNTGQARRLLDELAWESAWAEGCGLVPVQAQDREMAMEQIISEGLALVDEVAAEAADATGSGDVGTV